MTKGRFKWNPGAAAKVMNSAEIQAEILDIAQSAATRASAMTGESFVADVRPGRNRAHAMAKTTNYASRRANAKTNALLKGLG